MKTRKTWATAAFGSALAAAAQAAPVALQGRDINGNAVAANDASAVFEYDANLNLTWLRDWNINGYMDWYTAKTWAANLTVGAFGGWSLPTIDPGDTSCNHSFNPGGGFPDQHFGECTGSPIGYLYHTEGITPGAPGPFQNMLNWGYWSSTAYAPDLSKAWDFDTAKGLQNPLGTVNGDLAVAVRLGDVTPICHDPTGSPIPCAPTGLPEPATLPLVAIAMAGMGWARGRMAA